MTQVVISVQAGLTPTLPLEELTRVWTAEADMNNEEYVQMLHDVDAYAMSLRDPRRLNWVRTEWIWL